MPEQINDRKVFSLLEVARSIQKTLLERYTSAFWVKAEMNKLNFYSHSGHCYPELVEKREGKVIAQLKSVLWKDDYININSHFLRVIREPLKEGIKILFLARIQFDPEHGLALRILDIDPSYTLGDLEREKHETIAKLKAEGVFKRNKTLPLALLPQRIAIISVETSKGYADFRKVTDENSWRYKFFHLLFPSLLQGEKAVESITAQLARIRKVKAHFDVVAIIRGGGGDVGLSCYNNYSLARVVAMFPLPVITGIGHSTNETVVEMISFENAITPTKLGEFLIQRFHNFAVPVQNAEETIIRKARRLLEDEKSRFTTEVRVFRSATTKAFMTGNTRLRELSNSMIRESGYLIGKSRIILDQQIQKLDYRSHEFLRTRKADIFDITGKAGERLRMKIRESKTELNNLVKSVDNLNPVNVLKRGYSITLKDGKVLKDPGVLKKGDELSTWVYEGKIKSIVEHSEKKKPL